MNAILSYDFMKQVWNGSKSGLY